MKSFLMALVALFFSGAAFAQMADLEPMEFEGKGDLCQVVFVVDNVVFFETANGANNFCRGIHNNHFERGCFVRGSHGINNFHEANFSFQGGFVGNNFRAVSGAFNDFINQRRVYQNGFQIRSQYFNCLD